MPGKVHTRNRGALGTSIAGVLAALTVLTISACTHTVDEAKRVKIPQFTGTTVVPEPEQPPSSETWTPTWSASLPTAVAPPVTTPRVPLTKPVPPPATTKPTPPRPTPTVPAFPGGPFVRQGAACQPEGAIGFARTGRVLVCKKSPGDPRLRWRRP